MDIVDLEKKLFTYTKSEIWHQDNPGKLSKRYETMQRVQKDNQMVYLFTFENVFENSNIYVRKQSRFTAIPPHIHSVIELNYVYRGTSTQIINGETHILKQGDVCLLNTNVIHESLPLSENDIVITIEMRKEYFSTGFLSRCSSQGILSSFLANSILENTEKKQCLTFRDNKKMHMLIQQIACEFFDRGIASQEIIGAYMIILFSEMLKTRCNVIVNQKEGSEIIKMLKYIEKNYSEINLEKMADEFSFNSTYLSSYLKKYTGHTFKELVIFQRMFSANFYLLNSDLPIYEIAQKVGYNNLGFFYKRFQSIYGLTPQEYRNKNNISVI